MIASLASVSEVRVGGIAPLGPRRVRSGYRKQPVAGRVAVDTAGLAGDRQADRRVHGAPDKAVYAYPTIAYAAWRAAMPQHVAALVSGAMGENLAIDGLDDDGVAIGDRVRIGSALLQVTEPRQPCFKLGLAFADAAMVRAFMAVGVSGWYYRVLEAGTIGAGDTLDCIDRPNPDWPVSRFFAAIGTGRIADHDLAAIADLTGVADGWRVKAQRLLGRRGAV